jgi:hypothetical protein
MDVELSELRNIITFPQSGSLERKELEIAYGDGVIKYENDGFRYQVWDEQRDNFKLYIACKALSYSNSIYLSVGDHASSLTYEELEGSDWEPFLRELIIDAWVLAHKQIAPRVQRREQARNADKMKLLNAVIA